MFDFSRLFRQSKHRRYANVYDGLPTEHDVVEPFKLAVDDRGHVAYLLACSPQQRRSHSATISDLRLDRIDLTLNEKSHLTIPGLEELGDKILHFYALGHNELVLVDYNTKKQLLKQRLIEVFDNGSSITVRKSYDYSLKIPYPYENGIKTTVGKRFVVVMTRERLDGPIRAVKLSKRPKKSPESEREERRRFDTLLNEASTFISNENPDLRISSFVSPFFTEDDRKLNFFCTDRNTNEVDATVIASVDLGSGKVSLREATRDSATGFPCDEYGQNPFVIDCSVIQNGFEHVGLMTKYRTPHGSYRWIFSSQLFRVQLFFLRLFFFCVDTVVLDLLADLFLTVASQISHLRDVLVLRPEAKLGMLNTKSFEWRDVTASIEGCVFNDTRVMLSQGSGIFVVILSESDEEDRTSQMVRLVRSPFSCLSLGECAQLAIQQEREDFSLIERKRLAFQGHVLRTRKRSMSRQREESPIEAHM